MTSIDGSKRCPCRYQMHNGVLVGFSNHAVERAVQRNIDLEQLLRDLHGVKLKQYKRRGVIAEYNPYHKRMKIITVFHPYGRKCGTLSV